MGLDITAYEKVTLIRPLTVHQANAEDYDPRERKETLLYVDHPCRTQHDEMQEGIYTYSGAWLEFRAGSYSSYNAWRRMLAALVGTTAEAIQDAELRPGGPFVELIDFADNEGFIGPITSAKLAADFAAWRERAVVFAATEVAGAWFLARFDDWQKAFELASRGGAVNFH